MKLYTETQSLPLGMVGPGAAGAQVTVPSGFTVSVGARLASGPMLGSVAYSFTSVPPELDDDTPLCPIEPPEPPWQVKTQLLKSLGKVILNPHHM